MTIVLVPRWPQTRVAAALEISADPAVAAPAVIISSRMLLIVRELSWRVWPLLAALSRIQRNCFR